MLLISQQRELFNYPCGYYLMRVNEFEGLGFENSPIDDLTLSNRCSELEYLMTSNLIYRDVTLNAW